MDQAYAMQVQGKSEIVGQFSKLSHYHRQIATVRNRKRL
jgi:hypothetical protein